MRILGIIFLCSCGGLSSTATQSITNSANLNATLDTSIGDGGTYNPAEVRAMTRAAYCANASVLTTYNKPVPDAGFSCSQ